MEITALKDQLKSLQEELACLTAAENHTREQIESVLLAITEELENSTKEESEKSSGVQLKSLSDSLRRFETQHPELTDSINRVFIALSNMGI